MLNVRIFRDNLGIMNAATDEIITGADPGPVVGGDANPLDGGTNPIYFILFLKKPMKLKKFWSVGGKRAGSAPPPFRSATELKMTVLLF